MKHACTYGWLPPVLSAHYSTVNPGMLRWTPSNSSITSPELVNKEKSGQSWSQINYWIKANARLQTETDVWRNTDHNNNILFLHVPYIRPQRRPLTVTTKLHTSPPVLCKIEVTLLLWFCYINTLNSTGCRHGPREKGNGKERERHTPPWEWYTIKTHTS